jgi:hypothetical protein
MNYTCNKCNYSTKDNSNYRRHLKSKKHKNKSIVIEEKEFSLAPHCTPLAQILGKKILHCEYCNGKFSRQSSLARHILSCSKKSSLKKEYDVKIIDLQNKLNLMSEKSKQNTTHYKRELNHYKEEAKYYRYLFEEAGGIVKKSMSSTAYIQQQYTDAPQIRPLSIKDLKGLEQDKVKLAHNILYTYRHDTIDRYIGDQIIATCLTEDPFRQFIWNTDSSRFTYMIKTVVNKVSIWQVDKGGRETARFLIDPIMKEIKELMINHYKTECQIKEGDNAEKCIQLTKDSNTVLSIIENINDRVINDKILKYITPPLAFRKDLIK